jgi:PhzF family phenazine biosynthesis protein
MLTIPIFQVDAFTDKLFGGNPAAVCPLHEWLPTSLMQKIAAENNLAETAFYIRQESDFELRWFTPESEVDLCGHATLATAHVLFEHLKHPSDEIHFHTLKAGTLTVGRENDLYTLNFPSRNPKPCELPVGLIEAMGGIEPIEVLKSRDYFIVYENEEIVKSLKPDFSRLKQIESLGFVVTAPGSDCDFVSRFFAPAVGIDEDPVTGSAHCNLIPYWSSRLGKNKLHAYQVSARKGELWCENKGERVLMSGKAVSYLQGELFVNV